MTNEELEKAIEQLLLSQIKGDARLEKMDAQQMKTDVQIAKTDAQIAKTDAQIAKTDKTLKDALRQLGGIGKSQGEVAEEYFYNSLVDKKEINSIKFDSVSQNFYNKVGDIEGEYDMVLINGDSVGIVETKYKLKDEDVTQMINQQIPNFKTLFPMYKNYKLYAGLAGFKIPKGTQEKALKNGLFILKRKGEVMESISKNLKIY